MHQRFLNIVEELQHKFELLMGMPPVTCLTLPREMPKAGIYLFSEAGSHLYVGRSNKIRTRLSRHSTPGATHHSAAFAFLITRRETGNLRATYKNDAGSRANLMADPVFQRCFKSAKTRISLMSVRFVEETDPIRQALLEIYTAVVLQTPYNDFNTH